MLKPGTLAAESVLRGLYLTGITGSCIKESVFRGVGSGNGGTLVLMRLDTALLGWERYAFLSIEVRSMSRFGLTLSLRYGFGVLTSALPRSFNVNRGC